jgi:NtrC-family two-component system response regulator AlgB
MRLLVVDDEPSLRRTLRTSLESMGHEVADAADGDKAVGLAQGRRFDMAFLDLRLGREKGLDLLPRLLAASPGLAVVLITAYASVDTAVEAMRRGAFDYLPKPFTPNQVRVVLDRCRLVRGLQEQVAGLQEQIQAALPEADLSTQEPAMQGALEVAFRAAPTDATVLLRGESGTGKGVVARAIHARSRRAANPFVTVNCPNLSGELLESDLFGHARGAFTGAVQDRDGKVAAAEGGTLFLDEIGDMPLGLQPKVLRFLQERAYERVGETRTRQGDVRLIVATNRDLEADAAAGKFREDLLYRINVIDVKLPPLRERRRDLPALADGLLRFFARQAARPITGFTPEASEVMLRYPWPGNLRELRNAVERGVILAAGPQITLADLPSQVGRPATHRIEVGGPVTLEQLEREHIRLVLERSATLEEAARTLGINPSTLYRKRKGP